MHFAKAFEEFFYRAETSGAVILVAHANLIRYLMCRYVDPDAIGSKVMLMYVYVYVYVPTGPCRYRQKLGKIFSCAHTSFTTIRLHANGHVSLRVANYVEHLGHISIR